jgi:6-bladed beta-propeller
MAKNAPLAVVIVVSAMALGLSVSFCSKKTAETGWKAEIVVVDGVKTIRNPKTPKYGTFAFDLAEDLVIGKEQDEAYFFPQWAYVNVDDQGRFYVCDVGNRRVQVYDKNGTFIKTLGRQGQGPGEYAYPSNVLLDGAGDVYVNSGRSLVVFGPDGTFKKNILIKTFLNYFILGPGGTIVGRIQPNIREEGGPKNKLLQLGPDGEILRTIATYPVNGASPDQVLYHWYCGQLAISLRSHDSFFYGFSLDYRVHVVGADGRELFAFSKTEESKGISGQEADLTRESGIFAWYGAGDPHTAPLDLPNHRPFFTWFTSDDLGRLYVIRFKPITEKDVKTSDIDVFSKDGYYLYRMTWPFVPQVINGGFLYEVRQDEEAGLTKIIRHRIKNWGDFKSE